MSDPTDSPRDAAEEERRLREHEREAAKRDLDERDADESGLDDTSENNPAPPGGVQQPRG
jgi:hypothetical protein